MKVLEAFALEENTLNNYKDVLSKGWPVIASFDIFGDDAYREKYLFGESTTRTGIMHMPPAPIQARTDGHAVVFVGYDDATMMIKFKNSWGKDFGENG
ncbi:hypothetical protein BGZ67_010485, partial [Mortierella alpina]